MRSSAHPPIRSFARLHTLLTFSPFLSQSSHPWQSTKPKVRQLYLAGNPFSLRKDFRACLLAKLPQLVSPSGSQLQQPESGRRLSRNWRVAAHRSGPFLTRVHDR